MNDYPNVINDEISINLISVFRLFFGKWKIVLCVSLFAAVVGGLIGMEKTGRIKDSISTSELKLTDEQITDAQMHYSQICAYDRIIDDQRRINDESYIMSLDTLETVVYEIQYLIETDIYNPAEAYGNSLLSEDDYTEIMGFLGTDIGRTGLEESVSLITDMSDFSIPNDTERSYKLLLTLEVIAPSKDTCDKMVNIIDSAVVRKTELLKEQGAIIECILLSGEYSKDAASLIAKLQQERIDSLGSVITSRTNYVNNIASKVSEAEKEYLNSLLSNESNEPQIKAIKEKISWKHTVKGLFIGLFIGLFLSLSVCLFTYIINGRLHSSEELSENFRIPVMNTVSPDSMDTLEILVEELNNLSEMKGIDKIYIATEKADISAVEIAEKISDRVSKNVSCFVGGIELDAVDMKRLITCGGVFIIPVIDITKTKIVSEFLQICNRNDMCIIGSSPIKQMRK